MEKSRVKRLIDIRDLQKMGIRAIYIPPLRPSRVKGDKRADALFLFRKAKTVQEKKELAAKWNILNPGQEVSFSSLYRWDRQERMGAEAISEAMAEIPLKNPIKDGVSGSSRR